MEELFISSEELKHINSLKEKSKILDLQKQIADLALESAVLKIYVKYKLSEDNYIEEETGKICNQINNVENKE